MRILVVEDDHRMSAMIQRGLRENGYDAETCADGEQAIAMARATPYDAIVLDLMLPGVDGFSVCRQLRAGGTRTPILILTARDAVEDKIAGLDLGADDYLTKPFEFAELLARVRALLRRTASGTSCLYIGDLVVDLRAQRALRADHPIHLSSKEYALLEYLCRHAGRVVPRQEIAERVWDGSLDPLSNLIEVYVNRLRKKIDYGQTHRLIHTRRGMGYMVEDLPAPQLEA